MSTFRSCVSLLLLLCVAHARADDTAISGVGGAMRPMKGEHPTVRMVKEHVVFNIGTGVCTAKFWFKNEGPKTTVTMGFPETGHHPGAWADGLKKSTFLWLKSWVDGSPASIKRVDAKADDFGGFKAYWVKSVSFARGQERLVTVQYRAHPGGNTLAERIYSYTLQSGANWKGKIGKVLVEFVNPDPKSITVLRLSSSGKTSQDRKKHAIFRTGLEPTAEDDIDIYWLEGFADITFAGYGNWQTLYAEHVGSDGYGPMPKYRGSDVAFQLRALENLGFGELNVVGGARFELGSAGKKLVMRLGERTAYFNGKAIRLPFAPYILNGRTMIPLAAAAKAFGRSAAFSKDRTALEIGS